MSYDNNDDDFNEHNEIMLVKQVPKLSPSFAHTNDLHELIHNMEWEKVIERVKQKQKVRIISNNSNDSQPQNLPLEIECPTSDGDMPLFACLRHEQVPFKVIKVMIGECVQMSMNQKKNLSMFSL